MILLIKNRGKGGRATPDDADAAARGARRGENGKIRGNNGRREIRVGDYASKSHKTPYRANMGVIFGRILGNSGNSGEFEEIDL